MRMKQVNSFLIDNSSKRQQQQQQQQKSNRMLIVFLLLIGSFFSTVAQTAESGQFTTTVKKELSATSTTTEPTPLANLDDAELLKPISLEPDSVATADETPGRDSASVADSGLVPESGALFAKDAIDIRALDSMDCHLRNLDYCYAGMMGASSRALPETDAELETRCDEMRAMTSCMAVYNKRCQSMKVFSMLAPMANMEQMGSMMPDQMKEMPVQLDVAAPDQRQPVAAPSEVKLADLSAICSPQAKTDKANKQIRQRLFQLARCVNQRIPHLTPCIEDLKAAIQLFYEPRRALPLKPTCCALSRFRNCSMDALDGICGLTSFSQLENSLNSGPTSMLKTVDRICRQRSSHFDSPYCQEVLPPSGMRAPQRRGHRASKLAKALDLISFAPASQPMGR